MTSSTFEKKLLFAPMATLSHEALRHCIHQFGGCDEYYTEMIQATSFLGNGHFEKYYAMMGPEPEKIVFQLTCAKEDALAECAKVLSEKGGMGIDINMGCAAPDIYKQGAGIAWMLKPRNETLSMIRKVRNAVSDDVRLSVKMRLGDEDFTEQGLFDFADMLIDEGVSQIVLHPRTRKEKFRRKPLYQYIESLANHVHDRYSQQIKVIGNGDVSNCKDAYHLINDVIPHADGLMIGRAAIQKPWIFSLIKNPNQDLTIDLKKLGLDFIEYLELYQPKEFFQTRSARFFQFYCDNFFFKEHLRVKTKNAKTPEELRKVFSTYFEEVPSDQFLNIRNSTEN